MALLQIGGTKFGPQTVIITVTLILLAMSILFAATAYKYGNISHTISKHELGTIDEEVDVNNDISSQVEDENNQE